MTRFFTVPTDVYEAIRLSLDAQWGHPNGRADTCLDPASKALTAGPGRVAVALRSEMCEWPEVAPTLAQLLAGNIATEITQAEYFALLQPSQS